MPTDYSFTGAATDTETMERTVTIAGTITAGDKFSITLASNDYRISALTKEITAATTDAAEVAEQLFDAVVAETDARFTAIDWERVGAVITATAKHSGRRFYLSVATDSGGATIEAVTVQDNVSPDDRLCPDNWDPVGVPEAGDSIFFVDATAWLTQGLNDTTNYAKIVVDAGYRDGAIGDFSNEANPVPWRVGTVGRVELEIACGGISLSGTLGSTGGVVISESCKNVPQMLHGTISNLLLSGMKNNGLIEIMGDSTVNGAIRMAECPNARLRIHEGVTLAEASAMHLFTTGEVDLHSALTKMLVGANVRLTKYPVGNVAEILNSGGFVQWLGGDVTSLYRGLNGSIDTSQLRVPHATFADVKIDGGNFMSKKGRITLTASEAEGGRIIEI